MNNLPRVVTWSGTAGTRTCDLSIASLTPQPPRHHATQTDYHHPQISFNSVYFVSEQKAIGDLTDASCSSRYVARSADDSIVNVQVAGEVGLTVTSRRTR